MLRALTPAEQRGLLLVALLYLGGGAWDLWRTHRPPRALPGPPVATPADSAESTIGREASPPASHRGDAPPARLQLNRASERELDALPGIGPVLARRIVEHRRVHGSFRSVEELRAVRGIGPALVARLRGSLAADSL